MATVKVKFRPSSVNDREGTIYYQVIHNRVARQVATDYKVYACEWDGKYSRIVSTWQSSVGVLSVVTYCRRRTGQKVTVMWTKKMQEILDRYPQNEAEYLFPVITFRTANPRN